MPTPLVLVVDDPAPLRTMVRLLDQLGAEAVPATGLPEAVARLHAMARLPDLILTELAAPGVRGEELLRHVRGDRALAAIPVVAMSATPTDLPFDLYLEKPFTVRELRTVLHLARAAGKADERPPGAPARLLAALEELDGPARRISDAIRAVMVRAVIDEVFAVR